MDTKKINDIEVKDFTDVTLQSFTAETLNAIERITIRPVQNGFVVYLNDYHTQGAVRPVPYVFETMDNLLEFVKLKFEEDGNQN